MDDEKNKNIAPEAAENEDEYGKIQDDSLLSPEKMYNEDVIKSLESLEHIRQRSGMYIGRLGDGSHPDDGIYVMFKEVVDNSIDEFIMGYGRRIDISITDRAFSIRDYGRGIPLGKLVDCVSKINTGGKFSNSGYVFSVGMNGVGTKAVNALSELFIATSYRDGKFKRAIFQHGVLDKVEDGDTEERNGTKIEFTPDSVPGIFPKYNIRMDYVERRLWMYAYLNSGLSLYMNGNRYYSKNGLIELVKRDVDEDKSLYNEMHYKSKTLEFSFTHTADTGEKYYSFVNGQYTSDGGTHLSAFKGGFSRAIGEHFARSFEPQDLRDGILGAVAIKMENPSFESQTKNKLSSTEVKGWVEAEVKQAVIDWLLKNPADAEALLAKIERNEQVRKEIQKVKTKTKDMSKKLSLRNSKLKDCRYHFGDRHALGEESMIFLTEGDSAGSSLVSSRNPDYQAVYALRGKPYNCFGKDLKAIYDNQELYYIMRTLDIEDDVEKLRYAKIVIATDADVDGLHIRNLLLTFFLQYFESLVISGHVYIFETPLFRVRKKNNAKENFYCYSEEERDEAARKLGKNAEITRFKGLGEISPQEFKQFIGEDIRLEQVTLDNAKGVKEMLKFYMGDNNEERWTHIQNNLV